MRSRIVVEDTFNLLSRGITYRFVC